MTMSGHVSDELLLDVVDATAPAAAREHVAGCEACRARVAGAAEALALAAEVDVPEPPALYWEAFRKQVGRRLERQGRPAWRAAYWLLPLAAAAGLFLAVPTMRSPRGVPSPSPAGVALLPAWSALPPAEEDEGLEVLQAVATAEPDLVTGFERNGLQEMLLDLSDEESRAVVEGLKADVEDGGRL
ncbi:MAG TPA: hypothetical protein VLL75_11170 [Vicinamibacteria bacterium]|nr:hypothetical protein [Vicinamibacteria bacterium]